MSTKLLEGERALVTGCARRHRPRHRQGAEGRRRDGPRQRHQRAARRGRHRLPRRRSLQTRRLAHAARRRGREARLDHPVRSCRKPAPPRSRHAAVGERGNLGRHDRRQPALGLLPRPRDRPAHGRAQNQGPHPADHLAASRHGAQPAALQRLEGRHDHGDEGAGARAGAERHPGQCHRTRRHPGRRLRRRQSRRAGGANPSRPRGNSRRHRAGRRRRFCQKDLVVTSWARR